MAEHKEYWVTAGDQGTVKISEDVVSSIAALAASETEGVGGLASGLTAEIAGLLNRKNQGRGVRVQLGAQDTVGIELGILVKFGRSVVEVAAAVQNAVMDSIESMTGLKVSAVNVIVSGVAFDPPKPAEEALAPTEP